MGKWRTYDQPLSAASGGTLDASSVSLEENGEKTPVNYVLPPGGGAADDETDRQ